MYLNGTHLRHGHDPVVLADVLQELADIGALQLAAVPLEVRVDDGRCGDEEEDGERLPREPSHGATPELARYRLKY